MRVTLGKKPDAEAPWLGVEYTSAGARGPWDGGFGMMAGVLVARVAPDSPAAKAGMKERDLITAVEGVRVGSPRSVAEAVAAHAPGDSLTLTVARMPDGKETSLTVTLGENPSDTTKGYLGVSMSSFMGFQGPERPDSDSGPPRMKPRGAMPFFRFPDPPGI
jgi:S1-C subfamily serine protease